MKHGSEPLKITSTEVDSRNVFDHASAELAKHGLDAPSTELKKLLDVLEFKPRRLVKCGLAPPKALKCTAKGDEAEEPEDVLVVEALSIEDKEPDANTLHALLRMLHCRPARFVKLGLVEDVKAARQAYKLGGRACAKEWFRNKGGHGKGGKGWGRGLHGRGRCHGRGAGWAFEVSMEEEHHWGRRGGHGKGCHGRRS